MNLTPEQQTVGRRNFLKAVAGRAGAGGARRRRRHARAGRRWSGARGLCRPRRRRTRAAGAGRSGLCRCQGAVRHQPGAVDARRRGAGQDRQAQGDALRRLQGDARQGRHRRRDHRHAAVGARRSDRDLPRRRQARAVREDDGVGRRGLRADAAGGPAHRARARDRLSAVLQRDVPGGVPGHHQGRHAGRHLHGAHRLAPQRQLAPRRRPAHTRLRSVALGLQGLGAPAQLAPLQAGTRAGCWPNWPATR